MKYCLWSLLIISQVFAVFGQVQPGPENGLKPNVIRWSTASEQGNFGYDVYRGLAEEGPFVRVNQEPIAGAGTTDMPQRYEFRDESIEPDTVYWYYVESISLNGERRRMTPIYASTPRSLAPMDEQ